MKRGQLQRELNALYDSYGMWYNTSIALCKRCLPVHVATECTYATFPNGHPLPPAMCTACYYEFALTRGNEKSWWRFQIPFFYRISMPVYHVSTGVGGHNSRNERPRRELTLELDVEKIRRLGLTLSDDDADTLTWERAAQQMADGLDQMNGFMQGLINAHRTDMSNLLEALTGLPLAPAAVTAPPELGDDDDDIPHAFVFPPTKRPRTDDGNA